MTAVVIDPVGYLVHVKPSLIAQAAAAVESVSYTHARAEA
jgi:hypothetical protein